jgi:subtilisin family serine protease
MKPLLFVAALVAAAALPGPAASGPAASPYIVVVADGASSQSVAREHARTADADVSHIYAHALRGYAARLTPAGLAAVRSDARVRYVTPDREVRLSAQVLPTGVDRIDADVSSTLAGDGSGSVNVNVAVLDTGVDADHPDLNVAGGVSCTAGAGEFEDGNGHGTHVAGTIAAKDDAVGVVGVAPGARIWAARVLNAGGFGSFASVICGVDWATGTRLDADPSNDIAVANMSLSGGGADDGDCGASNGDALHAAICNSVDAGVTYAVAAGNAARDFRTSVPAAYDEVLTVTAVSDFDGRPGALGSPTCRSDEDDTFANFSNFATVRDDQAHTIAGPGVCILSTWKNAGYNTISGTSMATPHVAGTAALCIAAGCGTNPEGVMRKLLRDAEAYNTRTDTGYGFAGDPLRPVSGKYFGFLLRAGLY